MKWVDDKKRVFILLSVLICMITMLLSYFAKPFLNRPPYKFSTVRSGSYYVKEFSGRNAKGDYLPMVMVYWRTEGLLTEPEIVKLLDSHRSGFTWAVRDDNDDYTRWYRSDDRLGATHRKKDGRLCIYTRGFAEWQQANRESQRNLILKILQ